MTDSGIGLGSLLFVVFLVLKLVGVITWSWWWVTSPLWIWIPLFAILLAASIQSLCKTIFK